MSPEKRQVTARITKEVDDQLAAQSRKLGISKNAYIQLLLSKSVQEGDAGKIVTA